MGKPSTFNNKEISKYSSVNEEFHIDSIVKTIINALTIMEIPSRFNSKEDSKHSHD